MAEPIDSRAVEDLKYRHKLKEFAFPVDERQTLDRSTHFGISHWATLYEFEKGRLAQLARASRLHREGRGFKSLNAHLKDPVEQNVSRGFFVRY